MSSLAEPGTFAGNDAIVAFARSQQLKVVIHQLNTPLWEINGVDKPVCREMHIAYRYGDHYDSVRRIGDNSESPAQLRIETLQKGQRGSGDGRATEARPPAGHHDHVILSTYRQAPSPDEEENLWQLSAATINSEWLAGPEPGHAPPAPGSAPLRQTPAAGSSDSKPPPEGSNTTAHKTSKVSSGKLRKEQQRQDKKKRQEERHRQKVTQVKATQNHNLPAGAAVTLVPALNTLSI